MHRFSSTPIVVILATSTKLIHYETVASTPLYAMHVCVMKNHVRHFVCMFLVNIICMLEFSTSILLHVVLHKVSTKVYK